MGSDKDDGEKWVVGTHWDNPPTRALALSTWHLAFASQGIAYYSIWVWLFLLFNECGKPILDLGNGYQTGLCTGHLTLALCISLRTFNKLFANTIEVNCNSQ